MSTHQELTDLQRQIAEMARQIEGLAGTIERLYMLLTEKQTNGRFRVKIAPAQAIALNKARCHKARIARAARRYGLALEEWIDRFGPVDRLPPGVPRPPSPRAQTLAGNAP